MPDPQSITAGSLQHRVIVESLKNNISVIDGGHVDKTKDDNWKRVQERWARVIPRTSREFFRGQEVAADITHEVRMRADPESLSFTSDMRIKHGGRKLNLNGPPMNIDEDNIQISFPAIEIK